MQHTIVPVDSIKLAPTPRRSGRTAPPKRLVTFAAVAFLLAIFGFLLWRRQALMLNIANRRDRDRAGAGNSTSGHGELDSRPVTAKPTPRFPEVKGTFQLNITAERYPSIAEEFNQLQGTYHGVGYRQLSDRSPRAFLLYDTMPPEDCAALIAVAKEQIARSEVVHRVGESAINPVRTSYGMFIMNAVPADIRMRRRVADILGVPLVNVEATQILRYLPGQYYRVHPDYFYQGAAEHLARGGQRIATVLTWLNSVDLGGETKFPLASPPITVKQTGVGNSIMFYSVTQDGTVDPASSHEGVPPGEGSEKWVAVCWIRQREFH